MHYLRSIIGEPAASAAAAGFPRAAVLTEKGFVICDPSVLDTGWRVSDEGDPSERCEFRRGRIHIRIDHAKTRSLGAGWNLDALSGWIVILPFHSLPAESRALIYQSLSPGFAVPAASVKLLQRVREAYKLEHRRLLRLRDALADADYPSPVTLQPTGLHSSPLRIYARNRLRPLPLPDSHRLETILVHWSGAREVVEFQSWRAESPQRDIPDRIAVSLTNPHSCDGGPEPGPGLGGQPPSLTA